MNPEIITVSDKQTKAHTAYLHKIMKCPEQAKIQRQRQKSRCQRLQQGAGNDCRVSSESEGNIWN